MQNLREFLSESILDPIQENLSPNVWTKEGKLKPSVKTHIVKRLETWLRTKTAKKLKKLYLLGSITGFQYTSNSDIDVNFIIDLENKEQLKEIIGPMMTELNGKMLPGTQHPINYFGSIEFKDDWKGQALYDMNRDVWIKKPQKQESGTVITNYRATVEIARFFIAGMDLMLSEYYADVAAYEKYLEYIKSVKTEEDKKDLQRLINIKLQEIVADIDGIWIAKHMLLALRKEAFEKDEGLKISTKIDIRDSSNFSINNLIYKYVEGLGYFQKVKEVLSKSEFWNKKML